MKWSEFISLVTQFLSRTRVFGCLAEIMISTTFEVETVGEIECLPRFTVDRMTFYFQMVEKVER